MEQLIKTLSEQYSAYGYCPYSMSKFEEYGLYLQNKDFLISDRVLTFTDTDGRLMALKPDVTLSIIKNTADSATGVRKLFYRENVYRPGKNDQGFREIMQVGLECMGDVDDYCIFEVLLLAAKSLNTVSSNWVLDISHMGLVSRLLDEVGVYGQQRQRILEAIGSKNAHEIRSICEEKKLCPEQLMKLALLSGKASDVMPQLRESFGDVSELLQLQKLMNALQVAGIKSVNIDFSVVNDMNYYNGIVFRGFIEGIPEGVLSGGQYDGLMLKMNRTGKAIGFALYPNLLGRLVDQKQNEIDAVLLYDKTADITSVYSAVKELEQKGIRVLAQPENSDVKYDRCYRLVEDRIVQVEL